MFEKFVKIKNIGRFLNYSAKGDVAFRRLTLLFAENGRGKTTLCAILRSLQSGQHKFISERKTLGINDSPFVQIRLDGSTLSYRNNVWSTTFSDIAVFDSVFIHDNVYAGDYVEHDQKKNLYRVIVGTQGVQLTRQIEVLDGQIRGSNNDIRSKKDTLSRILPQGVSLENYFQWKPVEKIDEKIREKSEEISAKQKVIERASEIQAKGLFAKILLPSIPSDFTTILAKELTDITADAETKVKKQIAQHEMGHKGETWLSQGFDYVRNDECPFCGQNIHSNALIEAYRSYFNATYNNLKQEVAQLSQRINSAIGEPTLHSEQQKISNNLTLVEFWKQFIDVSIPDFAFTDVEKKCALLRDQCLALIQKKQRNPIEPIAPDANFSSSLSNVEALMQSVQEYNNTIESCNKRIIEKKESVQRGEDLKAIKNELANLEALKKRFEPEVVKVCKEYQDALQTKKKLDEQKRTAKEQLDQYCETILRTYERNINEYLDQFNAGFRIVNTNHQYTGGTPSSQFQIAINDCPIDLGNSRTPFGTYCFKTTLSAGDRSALALAFFLAVLKQDPQIGNKVVVLDDPFTSLDRFRRTCTEQLIRHLTNTSRQVIVLSHDPHFLKHLWDECPANEVKSLQMSKAGDTSVIGQWDIVAETQSDYLRDYSTLLDFYRERKGDPRTVTKAIRPFLEGMLKNHFPGHFLPNEWLGDFIHKISDADSSSGLQHAKANLNEIEAINEYSKKYHHAQNANADSEPINEDELHGYVKRTLNLVGGC